MKDSPATPQGYENRSTKLGMVTLPPVSRTLLSNRFAHSRRERSHAASHRLRDSRLTNTNVGGVEKGLRNHESLVSKHEDLLTRIRSLSRLLELIFHLCCNQLIAG